MAPKFRLVWPPSKWCIDFRNWNGGRHPLTGVPLRGGTVIEFGPLHLFWARD